MKTGRWNGVAKIGPSYRELEAMVLDWVEHVFPDATFWTILSHLEEELGEAADVAAASEMATRAGASNCQFEQFTPRCSAAM